jgi:hypothetical protein
MDVFRGKTAAWSPKLIPMWLVHVGTGVLGLWLLMQATA